MAKKKIVADIDESLHHAIKVKAAQERTTITKIIERLLKEWLEEQPPGDDTE